MPSMSATTVCLSGATPAGETHAPRR
jgi:hypothetical protein